MKRHVLPMICVPLAFGLAACSEAEAPAAGPADDMAPAVAAGAVATEQGNAFNPQDGSDIGLPLGMRLFPGAAVVSQSDNTVTFTAEDAAPPQVIDWYFRKLTDREFDFDMRGMTEGFAASSAKGTVDLSIENGSRYVLEVSPAG